MIESYNISRHITTGIIYVCVNTEEKWPGYTLNRIMKHGEVVVSFDNDFVDEIIEIDGFNPNEYQLLSSQEKDQISIVCIPLDFIKQLKAL